MGRAEVADTLAGQLCDQGITRPLHRRLACILASLSATFLLTLAGCAPSSRLRDQRPNDDCPVAEVTWTTAEQGVDVDQTIALITSLERLINDSQAVLEDPSRLPDVELGAKFNRIVQETTTRGFVVSQAVTELSVKLRILECAILRGTFSGQNRQAAETAFLELLAGLEVEKKSLRDQGVHANSHGDDSPAVAVGSMQGSTINIGGPGELTQDKDPILGAPSLHCAYGYGVETNSGYRGDGQKVARDTRTMPRDHVELSFDVTNPNGLDMRIVELSLVVVKWEAGGVISAEPYASGGQIRRYQCWFDRKPGSYHVEQVSRDYDYIKLKAGEVERFAISASTTSVGTYDLGIMVKFSVGTRTADTKLVPAGRVVMF